MVAVLVAKKEAGPLRRWICGLQTLDSGVKGKIPAVRVDPEGGDVVKEVTTLNEQRTPQQTTIDQ